MDLNWDDIRLFLSVARAQTLSKAGADLRLDPATVGRRVARLEATLGAALFVKSPQGYALTVRGQELLTRASTAEAAMRAATEGISAGQGDDDDAVSGQVRIGAPDGCANHLLPQVCGRLAAQFPNLDIQIVALPRVFNLSRREADMAIGVSAPTAGQLAVQRVTDYRLHFAASADYLDSAPPLATLDDLQRHRIVGYIPDMIFDRELDYLADAGLARVALASNSVAVQLNMLRQAGGVGVVHDFSLADEPGLQRVLTDMFSLRRSYYLIRHSTDQSQPMLTRFAQMLVQELRTEVQRLEVRVERADIAGNRPHKAAGPSTGLDRAPPASGR
ncbi:LysR family transcriptional regulator [uncultured Tateyamaria sp.]|uniref:LysR family transcriptional regulator n=1 Tax=uncultured Tateyamaria sp. TaxID=455651 RepID=UPI002611EAB6|nr:LysR family transcriptional regulator [uncultured Tateyamaria sp.]